MEKTIQKSYKISRIILSLGTFLIFSILAIIAYNSWSILILLPVFALIAFGLGFLTSISSRMLIKIGNELSKKILKILYYIFILPFVSYQACLYIFLIIYVSFGTLSNMIFGQVTTFFEYSIWFFYALSGIYFIETYIQTLFVLILNSFLKNKEM